MSGRRGGIRSARRAAPVTLGLTLAALGVQEAAAQNAQDSGDRQITVNGQVVIDSPKFTQPVRDTPQTIQVMDDELFNQQGATSLADALRNSPGVGTFYAGENGNTTTGDSIRMRGFDTSNSIFVDGVRDVGSISRDIFNTEQIEVSKGPAGTDNGRTAPAGAINLVSKKAYLGNAVSGIATIGVDGQKRATADLNQSLGGIPGSALRLNVLWQDSDQPGRDHVNNQRIGLAPSIGFGLGTDTRVHLNLLYVDQENIPDGYVPTIGLPGWEPQPGLEPLVGRPVDSENFYGTRADRDDVTATMATLHLEHDFSDMLKLSNTARWGRTEQDYLLTAFMTTSGNVTATDPSDPSTYTLARSVPTVKEQTNEILTNQLNLRADFATGAVQHNLSMGIEITHEEQTAYGNTVSGSLPPANLYNPDWNDRGTLSIARNGGVSEGATDTQAFYLFDTAKFFNEQLLITGGVRVDHFVTNYDATAACGGTGRGAVPCNGAAPGTVVNTADLRVEDTLFNWKLGAVYKPTRPLSLYVNYAVSQQPPGGDNFTLSDSANSANNPALEPQKAETIEAGVKYGAFGNRLLLAAAVFRTTVSNEINTEILDDAGNPTQTGEKRVQGLELSAVGMITPNWSISTGYSHLDTEVVEGAPVSQDGTENLTYIPGDSATLWTAYRLPFGLTLGGGIRYNDGLHRGTDGAAGTPERTEGYTVVDGLLSYALTENVSLRVNAYNLFDEEYVASINKSGYRYVPGAPRTFLFSGDFRF